jgi:hypothetical protein
MPDRLQVDIVRWHGAFDTLVERPNLAARPAWIGITAQNGTKRKFNSTNRAEEIPDD